VISVVALSDAEERRQADESMTDRFRSGDRRRGMRRRRDETTATAPQSSHAFSVSCLRPRSRSVSRLDVTA